MSKIINKYSEYICHHPFTVLIVISIITITSIYYSNTITMKTSQARDFLPKSEYAVKTLFSIEDDFGSTNILYFVIEIDPKYPNSNEVRDVRDSRAIKYMYELEKLASHTDDIIDVTGPASILKSINNGRLPNSLRETKELTYKNGLLDGYVNKDYTIARVRIQTTDDVDIDSLEIELNKIISQVQKPSGIKTNLGGDILEDQVMKKNIQPDMRRTSMYSLIGILIIVLYIFRSAKYGLIPLTTIIFGSIWAMGYVGFIGMGLSSTTSGVLSMIMGIGIDFGIQVVTRYRHELSKKLIPSDAMIVTLNNVIVPMSTTTIAALIGFQALHLGKLTFLGEIGTIMSYGVAACMLVAISVVPALIVIIDNRKFKNKEVKL